MEHIGLSRDDFSYKVKGKIKGIKRILKIISCLPFKYINPRALQLPRNLHPKRLVLKPKDERYNLFYGIC